MPATYEDTIIPGPEPTIERRYINGDTFKFTGDRAMAMADTPAAAEWRANNPEKAFKFGYSPYDSPAEQSPLAYGVGKYLRDKSQSRTDGFLGRAANGGILSGATVGGVLGAGGGALASLIARLFLGKTSVGKWALAGGALGALLGGHNGFVRSRRNPSAMYLQKSAATYTDPRNFILEKLQGANDIGVGEKVRLAASVKNMSRSDAEKLASLVRAALGFGVGAIIAKFFFGTSSAAGTLLGGVLGALGTNIIANNFFNNSQPTTFDFNFRPLSYRDIL